MQISITKLMPVILTLIAIAMPLQAQAFTDINAGLDDVLYSSVDWGDYDNDGDLDILLTGYTGSVKTSRIYRNDSGAFTDIYTGLEGVWESSAAWGDYDNDGDLDILMTGNSYFGFISRIYLYEGIDWDPPFEYHVISLEGVHYSSVDWGDYDNDGDLDILLTGSTNSGSISRIYMNEGGAFTNYIPLEGVSTSSAAWGDYDNDGDLDILLTGYSSGVYISRIYRNDSGTLTDINAGLTGVWGSSVAWGDYDSDGDLDILLTGQTTSSQNISRIYRNDSGTFTDINAGLEGVFGSSAAWGDYDNDGDLDILLTGGGPVSGYISRIYRNDPGTFTDINAGLEGVFHSSVAWGDYDNDGDLDILLTGMNNMGGAFSQIYRNNCVTANSIPSQPANLSFDQDDFTLYFSFDPASDAETSSAGLSYNIDIDIDIGDRIIKSASSDLTTGKRRLTGLGNIQQNTSWDMKNEMPADAIPQQAFDIIWKVQTVDNCFAGSAFASKNDTVINRDLVTVPKEIMLCYDVLTWENYAPSDSIASYTLQLSDDSLFTEYYERIFFAKKDSKTSFIGIDLQSLDFFESLEHNRKYFWRVKPEHVNPAIATGFKKVPNSFIFDPVYSAPSPVSIAVEGNYITLTWGTGKEAEKGILYNIYSSDEPYAVFPAGWTLVNSVTGTSYVLNSSVKKKFYCVTAAGTGK